MNCTDKYVEKPKNRGKKIACYDHPWKKQGQQSGHENSSITIVSFSRSISSILMLSTSTTAATAYSSTSTSFKVVAAKNKKQPRNPKSSGIPPPRITSNVKQTLQLLRSQKEFQKRKSSTPRPSTKYRRKKVEDEDIPDDAELCEDKNQGIEITEPVLLVDGYNVCGHWTKLKKHFREGRLDTARQMLIDELVSFSALRELKVVVVFDATMSGFPSHKDNFAGVDVVYTSGTCADFWIEKEVASLIEDGCPEVWVVTSDYYHQLSAYGEGAIVWSCKALISEINESHEEVEEMIREQRPNSLGHRLLKHNLDPKVVDSLRDLRQKLLKSGLK